MAPMDGLALTRFLRTSPASPDPFLPIIMITGFADRERVHAARDAGVTEFLVKPISAAALFSRIYSIIANPRPFVRIGGYFGPDRRRRVDTFGIDERRQRNQPSPADRALARQPLSQTEINILFNS
jgi:CheY-like chemotaxis protein